ncbi:MAG: hypothetical protein ACKV19_29745 [Verrucomicrobiales bacterium]
MRSLSSRERRLLMLLLVAGFIILNFLGYQTLAQRRTAAISQQRSLKFDIARLTELQAMKPTVDVNSDWINSHLPAYADIDQLETHLFNVVNNKAIAAGVELTKKDPRPTEKGDLVHKSILEIETIADMENLVDFLHSLQGREDFRFISFLELTPTKDEERVRCQTRVEQWWRADSEELAGIISSDVPRLPSVPLATPPPPPEKPDSEAGVPPPGPPPERVGQDGASPAGESPSIEQPAAGSVQPSGTEPAPPATPQ